METQGKKIIWGENAFHLASEVMRQFSMTCHLKSGFSF